MPVTPETDHLDQDRDEDLDVDRPPPQTFSDAVREAPLTAIATAFIAGLLVSRLLF